MAWNTLVSVDTLAAHLDDPDWIVFDCRFDLADPDAGRLAWQRAHVPGARYAHLDEHLSGPVTPDSGRHPLPDPDGLASWLGRQGVHEAAQVIAYDAGPGLFASRLWWLTRWLGHEAVAVLDGGLAAWASAGHRTEDDEPRLRPQRFVGHPGCIPAVDARTLAGDPERYCIVDARAPHRFRGDEEPLDAVAGHVPGARNRPFDANLEDGRFKVPDVLREEWRELLALAGSEPLVAMCGSGVSACHHVLALAHAGVSGVALYPGSWSEWIRDPSRPVARGDGA
ncbi:MAG TPA: sulfurtransferase [Gammaproteobacteria bacterium]|nr:sulfurtransferase [Gammaproteobacteria bacterium]